MVPAFLLLVGLGGLAAVKAQPSVTQSAAPQPDTMKFEVTSIKPSMDQRTMSVRPMPGGRLVATAPLKLLMMYAYGLQRSRILGGPDWINYDRYDIEAKAAENANRAQLMAMLQDLLEDRFRLRVHRETRETPVYYLVVDKGGHRLASPQNSECSSADSPPPSGRSDSASAPCGQMRILPFTSGARMEGDRVPVGELIRVLAVAVDRPVLDKTSLTGLFDIRLRFIDEPPGAPPPDSLGPTVFAALREQLGLRLEPSKGPVEFLVVDHVEHPTAN
jgi:uncharacterized protein (TIGR03435 family)